MSITFDTKSTGSGSGDPVTVSHTCSASTKMLVAIVYSLAGYRTDGVPTYNSVDMTVSGEGQRPSYTNGTKINVELFFLASPSTGSAYNVSVPNTNLRTLDIVVFSLEATGALSKHASAGAGVQSTANPSLNLTVTEDNGCAIGACANDKNNLGGYAVGAGYTEIYAVDTGGDSRFDEYDLDWGTGHGGTVTVDWTQALDDWGAIVIGFVEASAGGGDSVPYLTKRNKQHLLVR